MKKVSEWVPEGDANNSDALVTLLWRVSSRNIVKVLTLPKKQRRPKGNVVTAKG